MAARSSISSRSAVSRRTASRAASVGAFSAVGHAGAVSAVVPTYSSGRRSGSGYYGHYGRYGYYGGHSARHYRGHHHGHHHHHGHRYYYGCGWTWGVSLGWTAPYWGGYVSFGYPYYGYRWRWCYPWRYPYYVYYPYYRSHVYVSYPYGYVSYYYDPPYTTYYTGGTYYSDGAYVGSEEPAEAYVSDEPVGTADSGTAGVARQVIRPESATEQPVGAGDSEFLAKLNPAQFNFAMGFLHFEEGKYKDASDYFYAASLEDPDSDLLKLFLGVSLFSIGEYQYSAEYLRLAMDEWKAFLLYDWDLRALYRQEADFDAHRKLLQEEVDLRPSDRDARLVLAFVQYHSGDAEASGRNWEALEDVAAGGDPLDEELAGRYLAALRVRRSLEESPAVEKPADLAIARFLSAPSVAEIPSLPIR